MDVFSLNFPLIVKKKPVKPMFLLSQVKNDQSSPQKISGDLEQEPGHPTNDNDIRLGDIKLKRCELRLKRCDLGEQGGNTRLSEQRLLLSGDIEENPGPLGRDASLDTSRVCWDLCDKARNQSDSVNTLRLLLSLDIEENPGPLGRDTSLDTGRVCLDLSYNRRNQRDSVNTRLSNNKLLLSGDFEQNPGPTNNSNTRCVNISGVILDTGITDKGRNHCDSVNTRLSEHKLLLSGDVEDHPGSPQQKTRHLDTNRECLDLTAGEMNERLCEQKLLLSGDVELNPGPPKTDMFRVRSHLWRSTRVLVHMQTSFSQF